MFVLLFMGWFLIAGTSARAEKNPIRLVEGVYGFKGPRDKVNSGIVVGTKGVFVFNCQLKSYKQRLEALRKVSGGKPIRFVGNGHAAGDDISCNAH